MAIPMLCPRQAGINPVSHGEWAEGAAREKEQYDSFHNLNNFPGKTVLIELSKE
jgi:hypothetical protein